jgi:hypothetical protein
MNKKNNYKSSCCRAKVRLSNPAPDFIGDKNPTIGTCYAICTKCNQPCDLHIPIRKTWKINPKTQIIPNKKKPKSTKLTPKELKEIHLHEDF